MSRVVPELLGIFRPNHVAHPHHITLSFWVKSILSFEACDSHELD